MMFARLVSSLPHLYQSIRNGVDGRVSIEVDPRLAHDTEGTIAAGKELWSIIDRPNVMIKVPATIRRIACDHRLNRRRN